jgi:hypothetical protein
MNDVVHGEDVGWVRRSNRSPVGVRVKMSRARAAKIVLLSGNSLCHNPRVMKDPLTLSHADHKVEVLGAWLDPAFKERDLSLIEKLPFAFSPVLDVTAPEIHDRVAHTVARADHKAAQIVHRLAGRESPSQLGVVANPLLRRALSTPADLYIAHSEAGLRAAHVLGREGRRVGVDMEDWFSEDLLPDARRARPLSLLQQFERDVLRDGAHASCPSGALSAALTEAYGCARPAVIYNAFPWSDRVALDGSTKDRRDSSIPSVYWFSTTLGPGRGLEELMDALALSTQEVEIHLRGVPVPGFKASLAARLPNHLQRRLYFHGLLPNDQLLCRIAEHDIGFAGETGYCHSRNLTVTNKILHYLLAGIAAVASDTAGQREVAAQSGDAMLLYRCGDARSLAGALDTLLGSPTCLRGAKAAALDAARRVFCWERQEGALLAAVESALDQASDGRGARTKIVPRCAAS